MSKLLPRHMEIIEEIDIRVFILSASFIFQYLILGVVIINYIILNLMQFIAMIQSTRPELESKISAMRILDHNPQKPVVRMANLCVVSAHTVKCPFFRSLYSCYLLLYLIQNVSHILIKLLVIR